MSYIDTFSHIHLGYLAKYPIYLPEQMHLAGGRGDADFSCTPCNLVLGGGSGEHPGLVLHDFDQMARLYLLEVLDHVTLPAGKRIALQLSIMEGFTTIDECFEFCGWGVEQYARFFSACSSSGMVSPYSEEVHSSFERWLALTFGEFAWLAMPELCAGTALALEKKHPDIRKTLHMPLMSNLVILPAGYRKPQN